ncbi:MAG: peroxiredoxin [Nocardioidaceae bacterium]|nr:peroxiredoxin [Nocardioidaceae bacterium]
MTPAIALPAPDFTLRDQHGQSTTLSQYRGKQAVVVMFYPWAFSRVCTGELCDVRDAMPQFQNQGVQLVAISCDPVYSLRAYAELEGLDYPLLSDFWPHGEVAQKYGVFEPARGCALRGTFVIDHEGVLRWKVVNAIPDARNLDDYRAALAELAA